MQVQPNSTIYLLAGVPIDKTYDYTLYFDSRGVQTAYMQSMIMNNGTFTAQQYTRPEKNVLRVGVCADDVINCNYIMFKNKGTLNGSNKYADKWFYAFAHVQYLNEGACDVVYEIDDIQTWMFDYEFEECFVEREHSATDVAGDNLQPEPVDTGELVAQAEQHTGLSDYMLGAIVLSKEIRDYDSNIRIYLGQPPTGEYIAYNLTNDTNSSKNTVFTPSQPWQTPSLNADTSTGVSNGLYVYTGLLINIDDWSNYFSSNISSFYMNSPLGVYSQHSTNTDVLTLGKLIQAIVQGKVEGFSESNIVACYQYPANFHLKSAVNLAETNGYKAGMFEQANTYTKPTAFKYGLTPQTYYTPKNKKLLTSPFVKMLVTSQTGSCGEYRFEFFRGEQSNLCYYSKMGTYFCQPSAMFVPKNYAGKEYDYDSSLISSPYPIPIYAGDALQQWLQSNKNSFLLGGISAVIAALVGGMRGNETMALGGGAAMLGVHVTYSDKSNVPPNTYYKAQNEVLNVATKRTAFHIYEMALTPEYARKIDSFFTKYGYAVNELKIPNLQRGQSKRPNWNYLKVRNCMLHGVIPSDVEAHLEEIYERGITFWNYSVTVGDYSIPNPTP